MEAVAIKPPQNVESDLVFVSYSRNDHAACAAFRAALRQAGLPAFQDDDAIGPGERWVERLQSALQACTAFIVLIGRDGVQRWVGAEVEVALARHLSPHDDAQRLPIFPILLDDEGKLESLPPFLALFQTTRWRQTEALPDALIGAIKARASRFSQQPIEGPPYLGLSAFKRSDAHLFFGRREETLAALAKLGDQQQRNPEDLRTRGVLGYKSWLQIEGNSGAGKSSLVHAGLLPLIERGALWPRTGFAHWRMLGPMMPGKNPVENLAVCIERALIADETKRDSSVRIERLKRDERALALQLIDVKQDETAFLLIIDQFEELFTFAEEAERKQFDALLARAVQMPECPLFVISTVRADFLDRYGQLARLEAIYNSHCERYCLPGISERGLREVIDGPARLAGLDVHAVREAILSDARDEPGALPLVESALDALWEQRRDNRLSVDLYRQQGGLAGMLSAQADALLQRIEAAVPEGKQAALELLLSLTRINDEGRNTRRRVPREEAVLIAGDGDKARGERVLQLLSGERDLQTPSDARVGSLRLVTAAQEKERGETNPKQYVDLIHETLIRARGKDEHTRKPFGYWPMLFDYVEANRDRDILRRQLEFRAQRWEQSKKLDRPLLLAYLGLGDYAKLRVPAQTAEGRFLRHSRWAQGIVVGLIGLLLSYVGESFYTTRQLGLPMDSVLTLQRYRLGYAPVPTLVDIPSGSFDMGEADPTFRDQYEQQYRKYWGAPRQRVTIGKGFSMSATEVTFEQFDYYVWARQRSSRIKVPSAPNSGRGKHPVVNVTWREAAAYAAWLGDRSQQLCRLPTEAEWEYAARAGSATAYPWGDEPGEKNASCVGCGGEWGKGEQSAPAGQFEANKFGLYDTAGNVWEWTCSAFQNEFDGSEQRCIQQDDSAARAMRGGAWNFDAALARPSARYAVPIGRSVDIGFRVLCSSPIE